MVGRRGPERAVGSLYGSWHYVRAGEEAPLQLSRRCVKRRTARAFFPGVCFTRAHYGGRW